MASKLKAVEPKKTQPKKPKVLITGGPGLRKTLTALDFPSNYYCDSEQGATGEYYQEKLKSSNGMYLGVDQGALDFEDVIGQVQGLATEKHHYRTFTIDSYTKLYNTAIAAEYERLHNAGKKIEFSVEKKPAASFSKRLINWLSRLDMTVLVICHEKPLWQNGEQIGMTFDGYDKLEYEFDLSLHIKKSGGGSIALVKKSRLPGFKEGESFTWTYEEFAIRYGKEILEKESVAIELATEEQLREINKLLEVVKLPEGQIEKWLNAKQVEDWSEMSSESIAGAISHIKTLLSN